MSVSEYLTSFFSAPEASLLERSDMLLEASIDDDQYLLRQIVFGLAFGMIWLCRHVGGCEVEEFRPSEATLRVDKCLWLRKAGLQGRIDRDEGALKLAGSDESEQCFNRSLEIEDRCRCRLYVKARCRILLSTFGRSSGNKQKATDHLRNWPLPNPH